MGAGGAVAHSHAVAACSIMAGGHGGGRSCERTAPRGRIILVVIHLAHCGWNGEPLSSTGGKDIDGDNFQWKRKRKKTNRCV